MHWPTLKFVLIRVIPGLALSIAGILVFHRGYAPSPTTLDYLYSSVFQGLAALVAVSLAIVYYVSDRLENLMEVHLTDARKIYNQFYSVDPTAAATLGYEILREGLGKWFTLNVAPRWYSLNGVFATYRATPVAGRRQYTSQAEATELKPLIDEFLRLKSHESNLRIYDDCASHLGRYQRAQYGWSKLPKDAALAFGWSLVTIMFAVLLLATVDYAGPENSNWTIALIAGTLLSIVYMALLFRTLLNAYFGSDRIKGIRETQLPDPYWTWQLIKDVQTFLATYGLLFP